MTALDQKTGMQDRRRAQSAAAIVYENLRESVISMELAPDAPLSRKDLLLRYNVSQTPLREAILRLEQEGLVKTFPQSKTIVTRIDVAHLREAHFLRTSIEVEIAGVLAQANDPSCVDKAQAILEQQRMLGTSAAQQSRFAQLDRAFHYALYAAAGQSGLADLVHQRSGHLDRVRRLHLPSPGKMGSIMHEHQAILGAIRSGNCDLAANAVRAHLTGTIAAINRMIDAAPDFFAVPGGSKTIE